MNALEDSIVNTSKERSNDISKKASHRRPSNRQLPSSRVWESEMDFDCDDGLEELRKELEGAGRLQAKSIGQNIDEGKPATSQQVTLSRPRRVSEHTGSILGHSKIIQTVSEESENESQGDVTSNLVTGPSSRLTLNKAYSFIKQQSLFNLVSRMDALEDSIDNTSEERSNDIYEELSHKRPPNRQLPSSRMWESEMDFDCDGLEELQSELEGADPLQAESIGENIDEGKPEASQHETLSKPRQASNLQIVFEESETESQGDDTSNLARGSSSRLRFNKGFSFIKQKSLFNLLSRVDAFEDSMDDTSKERSNDISKKASHRQPPNRQLQSSRMWESEMDFDCDDGLEESRRKLERSGYLQIEPSASEEEIDDIDAVDSVAGESFSQVKQLCTVSQQQLIQMLKEKNYVLANELSKVTAERNQLKERQDGALLKGKLTLDGKDVNSQKWVADILDKSNSKRKPVLWSENWNSIPENSKQTPNDLQNGLNPHHLQTVCDKSEIKLQVDDNSNLVTVSPSCMRGVIAIDDGLFKGCALLVSVVLPTTITTIGDNVFWGCSSLLSVTLPTTLTTLGDYVFHGCSSLVAVSLPITITTMGSGVFNGCFSLVSVLLPNTLTTLGDYVFHGCSSLVAVSLPTTIATVGNGVFNGCSSLVSVLLPSTLTEMGEGVFNGCSSLVLVALPATLRKIGREVFNKCILLDKALEFQTKYSGMHEFLRHRFVDLPLHSLCYYYSDKQLEAIKKCITEDLFTTIKLDICKMTALHILGMVCVTKVNETAMASTAKGILQACYNANKNAATVEDIFGRVPIHYAAMNPHTSTEGFIDILARAKNEKGYAASFVDKDGNTPLSLALQHKASIDIHRFLYSVHPIVHPKLDEVISQYIKENQSPSIEDHLKHISRSEQHALVQHMSILDNEEHIKMWTDFIQDGKQCTVDFIESFAKCNDMNKRSLFDVARPAIREALSKRCFSLGCYRIDKDPPICMSNTAVALKVVRNYYSGNFIHLFNILLYGCVHIVLGPSEENISNDIKN